MMASYILIHGAWHAGWCWKMVATLLSAEGHQVIVPDLPGHGANKKKHSEVKLIDYIDCIKDCLATCDQAPILVGHSFAGMLLSQFASENPGKFKKLIYVAAYVPFSGESMLGISENFAITQLSPELVIDKASKSIALKPVNLSTILLNCTKSEIQSWVVSELEAEPLVPLATPVVLNNFSYHLIDTHYILCQHDRAIMLQEQQWMAERTGDKHTLLVADHSPFFSEPELLAKILME